MNRKLLRDLAFHVPATLNDAIQRDLQLLGACILADVTARASLQSARGIHGFRVHAENQNANCGTYADEPA